MSNSIVLIGVSQDGKSKFYKSYFFLTPNIYYIAELLINRFSFCVEGCTIQNKGGWRNVSGVDKRGL